MPSGNRQFAITMAFGGGGQPLKPVWLDAHEGLSQPFTFVAEVISSVEVDLLREMGKPAAIESLLDGVHMRYFHGVLIGGSYITYDKGEGHVYHLTLAPATWFHEQGSHFQIYQHQTVIGIIKDVLDRMKVDYKVEGAIGTRQLPFCVQYGESDFAFISRLMEEEGIYYYYRHEAGKHVLTLLDAPAGHPDLPQGAFKYMPSTETIAQRDSTGRTFKTVGRHVQSWNQVASSGGELKVRMRDFDFIEPTAPKQALAETRGAHDLDAMEVYRFPGRFFKAGEAEKLSETLLQSRRAQRLRYEGGSRNTGIQPGFMLTLSEHPADAMNGKYLVIECRTRLANEQYRSGGEAGETMVRFTAIPAKVQFRAPMVTPRPVVRGPETAIVTGPEGEEINVDKYGRISVKFHFDLGDKKDGTSSCWVRVAQFGACGSIDHPRVGEEVLIDFINGNPDRPIVVGRVYNEANRHTLYELPRHKTMTVIRTDNYKSKGFKQPSDARPIQVDRDCQRGGSEFRIDDDTDKQQVFIYAEKNMDRRVSYLDTLQVGKDQTIEIGKNRNETVYENETIKIIGDRKEEVHKTETVDVTGDRKVTIKASDTLKVTSSIDVKSDTSSIMVEAATSITLKVGMNSVTIDQSGVTIKGAVVNVNGTTVTNVSAPATNVSGTGTLVLKGGLTTIN